MNEDKQPRALAPHPDTLAPERSPFGGSGTVVAFPSVAEAYAAGTGVAADVREDPRAIWLVIPSGTFEAGLFDLLNSPA